jgi:hemoglobin
MAGGYAGRLGGADAFGLAVEAFYRRVLRDPELQPYFAGIDLDRLHHHQYAFLAMAVGGVRGYLGRTMAAAHAGLGITDEAFDRVLDHLVTTLAEAGMDSKTILDIGSQLLPLRDDICEAAGELSFAGRSNRLE